MKVRNIGKRGIVIDGQSLGVNQAIIVPDNKDITMFLNTGQVRVEGAKISEKLYDRKDLKDMKMGELREIGKPLGAKDTSKSELIEEIIEKQEE